MDRAMFVIIILIILIQGWCSANSAIATFASSCMLRCPLLSYVCATPSFTASRTLYGAPQRLRWCPNKYICAPSNEVRWGCLVCSLRSRPLRSLAMAVMGLLKDYGAPYFTVASKRCLASGRLPIVTQSKVLSKSSILRLYRQK